MNREEWLNKAFTLLDANFFERRSLKFETKIRVSVGWPRGSKRAIGQCWPHQLSQDKTTEIFISPQLDNSVRVLDVLLHEMIHAHLGTGKGHGPRFKALVNEFGLDGRVTSTYAKDGTALFDQLTAIALKLGDYPHKSITPIDESRKRMIKSKKEWPKFKSTTQEGYSVRVSPASVVYGAPLDPWGYVMIESE